MLLRDGQLVAAQRSSSRLNESVRSTPCSIPSCEVPESTWGNGPGDRASPARGKNPRRQFGCAADDRRRLPGNWELRRGPVRLRGPCLPPIPMRHEPPRTPRRRWRQLGESAGAIAHLERAVDLCSAGEASDKTYRDACSALAVIYERRGDAERAAPLSPASDAGIHAARIRSEQQKAASPMG